MNERERYLETMLFGQPDRIPFSPGGARKSTRETWHRQGLPEGVDHRAYLRELLGIEPLPDIERTRPRVDFRMIPQFEEEVLEERESTLVVRDWKGNVCEISNQYDVTYLRNAIDFVTRTWIKCPVETRDDWQDMKRRYDVDDPARFEEDFAARAAAVRDRRHVIVYSFPGPFWQLREWCGFENLCMLFLDDPDFVREMVDFWRDFLLALLERVYAHLIPDEIHFSEDMAYKEKAMISPAMCREFLLPCWTAVCEQARSAGVPVRGMDSDGYIAELIPLWIEAGMNACDPIEVAAGNDINDFRRRFGRKMAYRGGVDKRAMAKGGKVIEAELARIEPVIRDGGYLPKCDHGVPPDVSWPDFVHYSRRLAELTGWL